jgi:hypothetical protein
VNLYPLETPKDTILSIMGRFDFNRGSPPNSVIELLWSFLFGSISSMASKSLSASEGVKVCLPFLFSRSISKQ